MLTFFTSVFFYFLGKQNAIQASEELFNRFKEELKEQGVKVEFILRAESLSGNKVKTVQKAKGPFEGKEPPVSIDAVLLAEAYGINPYNLKKAGCLIDPPF